MLASARCRVHICNGDFPRSYLALLQRGDHHIQLKLLNCFSKSSGNVVKGCRINLFQENIRVK